MSAMSSTQSRYVWKQRTDLCAAFPMRSKGPLRAFEKNLLVARPVLDLRVIGLDLFSMIRDEPRLRIEGVHMRNAAAHVHENHALRPRGKMRRGRLRIGCREQLGNDARHEQRTGGEGAEESAAGAGGALRSHGKIMVRFDALPRVSKRGEDSRGAAGSASDARRWRDQSVCGLRFGQGQHSTRSGRSIRPLAD